MARRDLYLERGRIIAVKALTNGATRRSLATIEWSVAGKCRDPKWVSITARPSPRHRPRREPEILAEAAPTLAKLREVFGSIEIVNVREQTVHQPRAVLHGGGHPVPTFIDMEVRCRKCDWCLEQRRRLWAARAIAETRASVRTWFGTLTLRPEAHTRSYDYAWRDMFAQGVDLDGEAFGVQFVKRCEVIGPWITRYVKRVRESSGAPLRLLCVTEHHKSGLPHYHLLVHEVDPARPVRKKHLKAQWWHGHSDWRLVDEIHEAGYVCKYLAKSSVARVRASLRYGQTDANQNA